MARNNSLLAGRNRQPLSPDQVKRAINTFIGMGGSVDVRYDPDGRTVFRVVEEEGEEYGQITVGPDIYPGSSVADPNSALSVDAAAAHELTHFHRWRDKLELTDDSLEFLDEALTSLQAILRFEKHLKDHDVRQLVHRR